MPEGAAIGILYFAPDEPAWHVWTYAHSEKEAAQAIEAARRASPGIEFRLADRSVSWSFRDV
jgi:choline-glycine betaine transporter